jgi:hypothetical protein
MTSRKKKKGKRKSNPKVSSHRAKVLLAALFVSGFLVLSLVLLSQLRNAYIPATQPSGAEEKREVLDDIRVELESVLLRCGATLDRLETGEGGELRMEARGEFPPAEAIADLDRRVRRISANLRLEARPTSGSIRISGEEIAAVLRFHRPAAEPPAEVKPKMVIIMDDLGRDLDSAQALLDIDLPVTFAILPGTANASRVATLAYRRGREVLIHIPMEPRDYPGTNPGRDALLVEHSDAEIRRRFQAYLDRIPYAVGGNNHMGSRFTENREKMEAVLAVMKEAGLFFVDSLTTGRSVAFEEARKAGLPTAVRDVFLDNVQDVERISLEIRRLAVLAVKEGSAVGICHPYPQTLEALRRAPGYLREQGIEVVPASQVLIRQGSRIGG